ncbi:MAG: hypothetical protein PWP71_2612 [Clostridia bacterium]|nr:hypothetical protein [Clostridia bacterium]
MTEILLSLYYATGVATGMIVSSQDPALTATVTIFSFLSAYTATKIIDHMEVKTIRGKTWKKKEDF